MKKPFLNKITFNDIRVVFFTKDFHEKYRYLGSVPWKSEKTMLHALVIAMDHEAKPNWCPRWFLRFLYLFGCDNSIVRVRNQFLCNLHHKLTKGIKILDYKTKWTHYDLRISLSAPEYLYELSQAIETYTYQEGEREDRMENLGV